MIVPPALAFVALLASASAAGDDALPPGVSCDPVGDVATSLPDGVSAPRALTKVEPTYPEALRRDRVEGKVAFNAVICSDGVPRRFELAWEKPAGFRESALEAASQWRYEPARRDGQPVAVRFSLVVAFGLPRAPRSRLEAAATPEPIRARVAGSDVTLPVLKSKVEPRYPDEHRRRWESGRVVFEARIEKDGSVGAMKALEATSYAFELAAREAVKQWVYEPARRDGEPVAVDFTIVVKFALVGAPLSKNRGKVAPPTLRHDVPPIYPPALLAERRNGSVSVEIFVARDGAIEKVEILSATDPAFADAVRAVVPQWKFAPGRLDGVPTATSLKLTIPFEPPAAGAEGTENR